jgi:2-polyprenyl-3-methyl-5-hydroxy-6-metoxy-1,4-benzoquinol methylase
MIDKWEKQIKKNDFVLDIGCWSGKRVLNLTNISKNVYGMDINAQRFSLADKKIKNKLFLGDVTKKIPFKKKFDWIILSEVLEHVSDDSKTLKNINKSMKIGGRLILSTPKSIKYFEFWDPAWVKWKFFVGERHYHYTKEELFQKLKNNNFQIEEYYILGGLLWIIKRWINVFLKYIFKSKKQLNNSMKKGFCDWFILAKKIK